MPPSWKLWWTKTSTKPSWRRKTSNELSRDCFQLHWTAIASTNISWWPTNPWFLLSLKVYDVMYSLNSSLTPIDRVVAVHLIYTSSLHRQLFREILSFYKRRVSHCRWWLPLLLRETNDNIIELYSLRIFSTPWNKTGKYIKYHLLFSQHLKLQLKITLIYRDQPFPTGAVNFLSLLKCQVGVKFNQLHVHVRELIEHRYSIVWVS